MRLRKTLPADIEQIIASGDVEAVARAAVGISIGGGCDDLVAVADIVAPAVGQGGLAWALAAAGLIDEAPTPA